MYKVLAILLYRDGVLIDCVYRLDDFYFFTRGSIKEVINFACDTIVNRIHTERFYRIGLDAEHRASLQRHGLDGLIINYYSRDGIACCIVTREAYTSQQMIKLIDMYIRMGMMNVSISTDILDHVEEQLQVDPIMMMQGDIKDIQDSLIMSIDKLLERGEKLDSLIEKTDKLSDGTKGFLKNSERLNRCCVIL